MLNASDLDALMAYEKVYGARVNSILQLRLHPSILALRDKVQSSADGEVFDIDLRYMTSRGKVVHALLEGT